MYIFLTKSDMGKKANTVFYTRATLDFMDEHTLSMGDSLMFLDSSTYEIVQVDNLPKHYNDNKFIYDSEKKEFSYINEGDEEIDLWTEIREHRNQLLKQSDIDSGILLLDRWNAKTDFEKNIWLNYRQALRDLPKKFTNSKDVVWPKIHELEREELSKTADLGFTRENKAKAIQLLQETDWVEIPSVANTSKALHLTNYNDFVTYRDFLRSVAVNPSANDDVNWPTPPEERWSTNTP